MGGETIFPETIPSCLLFGRGALTHYQKRTKTMFSEPHGGENSILSPFSLLLLTFIHLGGVRVKLHSPAWP